MNLQSFTNNQIINVQAYKHNGELYRQWNGVKIIKIDKKSLILLLFKTKVKELKGQKWVVREPMIWWFPFKKFFNTTALVRNEGIYYYTNIASPPFFEDNTLKFIDYDLDIKNYPKIKNKLVDKKEFAINTKAMGYSPKLLQIIEETIILITQLVEEKKFFFNEEYVQKILNELFSNKYLSPKNKKT